MAFGYKVTSGDYLPIVKYDARAGKFFKVDKRPDGGSDTIALPPETKFAVDFGTIEAGYATFTTQGPIRKMQPYIEGQPLVPEPQDKDTEGKLIYRPAFYLKICGNALDGLREWIGASASVMNAMDDLYQAFTKAPEAAAGQIPIISIPSTVPVKTGSGTRASTNYTPVFRIEGWTPRPDMLGPRTVPAPGANGHANMTTQAAQQMAAASVQQPVTPAPAAQPPAGGALPPGMHF